MNRVKLLLNNIKDLLIKILICGIQHQAFLGVSWVKWLIQSCPKKYKRGLALRILALSPHYIGNNENNNITYSKFLELSYQRYLEGRKKNEFNTLTPYLNKEHVVIDYGCGPGVLTIHLSHYVNKVFGIDISNGVLECARILNPSNNITYLSSKDIDGIIENNSIDLIFSFSVIQHITDDEFKKLLKTCYRVLKKGGMIMLHVPVEEEQFLTEEEWRQDRSLVGKIKWQYALKCFCRTKEGVGALVQEAGFNSIKCIKKSLVIAYKV